MATLKLGKKLEKKISLRTLEQSNFAARLWKKDATLWLNRPDEETKNRMGWLTVPGFMLQNSAELETFAADAAKEFKFAVVLGMGGSSLAPEVFARVFPVKKGYPRLLVLDSTNPAWVEEIRKTVDLGKTLFIYSSKSGGTVEPNSFYRYFRAELEKITRTPGKHFVAITDKGSGLETLAKEQGFRKIFINPSDIGGRFSALSYFGLVPAALMGIDVRKLLERAARAGENCRRTELKTNDGVLLGAALGQCALSGADKLTVITGPELETFGLWIEQLTGESTGKNGKGIVPVAGEKPLKKLNYGNDRLFVGIGLEAESVLEKLEKAGHYTAALSLEDIYDLGAQFMLWEVATAAAGAVMGINPYDQPNVQEAKSMAQKVLSAFDPKARPAPVKTPRFSASQAYADKTVTAANWAATLCGSVKMGDYIGILAYTPGGTKEEASLKKLRALLVETTGCATLFGYGPRYLHSTGQLHKGGANNAIFLMITCDPRRDLPVPGQKFSFDGLCSAQAEGDFKALEAKGRRVIRVHLPAPCAKGLAALNAGLLEISKNKQNVRETMPVKTKPVTNKTATTTSTAAKTTVKPAVAKATTATTRKTTTTKKTGTTETVNTTYVTIDYPITNETISQCHYVFRIGASSNGYVELCLNNGEWLPCRHSVGYWWYDWNATPGNYTATARITTPTGVVTTKTKRFKVA
ncbi:MAG: hypothetical protein PHW69_03725 [Elusimicrobiaceae bacterium]|nr:hypothetical protein [Elusimicrobiaceae bacterium]